MGKLTSLLVIIPLGLMFPFAGVAPNVADFQAVRVKRPSLIYVKGVRLFVENGIRMERERIMQEERRNSDRIKVEIPLTFGIGKNTFFGTATNLSNDGMMIEASLARKNFLRIFKPVLKTHECPVELSYSMSGRSFSRRGKIKHYHVDFSGAQSAYRLSFGVWIPKMKMRDGKKL